MLIFFYNDNKKNYFDLLVESTKEMLRISKSYVIINLQCNYYNKESFYKFLGVFSNVINGVIIWHKTNPKPASNYNAKTNQRSITNAFEYFIILKDGKDFKAYGSEQTSNIISSSTNRLTFKEHKAIMKKEICNFFIKKFSKEGDLILDPFLGSGTTAVVCKELKRNYIGFEIIEEYINIAKDRIKEIG